MNLDKYTRCWVFPSEVALVEWELKVQEQVEQFLSKWKNERNPLVQGGWTVLHEHFVVFFADEREYPLSGCSIDSMHRFVSSLGKEHGMDLPSRKLFYQNGEGQVQCATRPEFKELVNQGEITQESLVFDTTVTNPKAFLEGTFLLPVQSSWHKALCPT